MKHAGGAALAELPELLDHIRIRDGLKERKLGIFYRKSKSFLHFHEDPAGLFADLSTGADFVRYPVNTRQEWNLLLAAIDRAIKLSGYREGRCGAGQDGAGCDPTSVRNWEERR